MNPEIIKSLCGARRGLPKELVALLDKPRGSIRIKLINKKIVQKRRNQLLLSKMFLPEAIYKHIIKKYVGAWKYTRV